MTTLTPEQQALQAAAPILISVFQQLQTFVNTTLTGDPMLIPGRASAAADILLGNIKLQLPALLVAEEGVLQSDINAGIGGIITKLQALGTPTPPATPPAA